MTLSHKLWYPDHMTQTPDLPRHIADAVHTAVSEIPDAHPDDILDCVFGMIPADDFDANLLAITEQIARLR
jgi:hypothetical protein